MSDIASMTTEQRQAFADRIRIACAKRSVSKRLVALALRGPSCDACVQTVASMLTVSRSWLLYGVGDTPQWDAAQPDRYAIRCTYSDPSRWVSSAAEVTPQR
jgi:hypothetical protein